LPSGGSLVIDRTEAMTVVDVNTGKFVGSGGNLEETVTKNNLEAADEIVRQLRLRDIGGIIVIDFIDMVLESNRDMVLQRLMECLSRDRTKHQVAEVTSLGLVQMTRKKLGLGLLETFSEACDVCGGRGVVVHHEPVSRSRQSEPSGGKKRKSSAPATQPIQTHQITDDARNAIAQIAKSTVGVAAKAESEGGPVKPARKKRTGTVSTEEMPKMLDSVLQALPEPPAQGSSKRRRRATSRDL
jgi:ribonuclease E